MERAGVPVRWAPPEPVTDVTAAVTEGTRIRSPVTVKAAAGPAASGRADTGGRTGHFISGAIRENARESGPAAERRPADAQVTAVPQERPASYQR